jgi:hypothetical protein
LPLLNFISAASEFKTSNGRLTTQFNVSLEMGVTCGTHGRGEENVHDYGGKARRKETTWKTKA